MKPWVISMAVWLLMCLLAQVLFGMNPWQVAVGAVAGHLTSFSAMEARRRDAR